MEARRRERRHREVLTADLDRHDAAAGLWAEAGEWANREALREAVRAAVAGALTEKQRAVVEACYFEGLSQGEAARRLGVTQQVVGKALHGAPRGGRLVGGALRRLREALAPVMAAQGRAAS
jgi:DNA-directed RNA polymerase specialized sigma24 family protein